MQQNKTQPENAVWCHTQAHAPRMDDIFPELSIGLEGVEQASTEAEVAPAAYLHR